MNAHRGNRRLGALSIISMVVAFSVAGFVMQGPARAQQTAQNRSVLVLLCSYADKADTWGLTSANIQTQWTGPNSISGYVSEMSLGTVDVSGSRAFGWFRLPSPRATYGEEWTGTAQIGRDCVTAAAAGGVDTTAFDRVAVYLNDTLPGAEGRQGTFEVAVGGRTRTFNGVFVNLRGLTSPPLMLHELGHSYGGDHTGSPADPLGLGAYYGDSPATPRWGLPLVVANAAGWDGNNRDRMGFIPANRKITFAGGTQQITMTRLTQPGPDGAMLVTVPVPNSTTKYVVSARTRIGYDAQFQYPADRNMCTGCPPLSAFGSALPAAGVMIQQVAATGDPAPVFSTPGGDPNSAAAMWVAGQTFTDTANNLRITVDRFDDNGAQITVTGPGSAPATTATPAATISPATTAPATTAAPATIAAPATTIAPAPGNPPAVTGGPAQNDLVGAPTLATPMTVGPQNTSAATVETGEARLCGGIGATLWFRFVASQTGSLTVTTDGSDFDTVVAAYRGPASGATHAGLVNLSCNDDANGTSLSSMTISVTAGEVIYVQAGGYAGATGNLTVKVQ